MSNKGCGQCVGLRRGMMVLSASPLVLYPFLQLMAKIKAAIARQWQKKNQNVDWDLLERMEQHQKAVASAIVAQSGRGEG